MRLLPLLALVALAVLAPQSEAQFFRNLFRGVGDFFRPIMRPFRPSNGGGGFGGFGGGGSSQFDKTGGTKKPQATGHDNPFPDDCGRDEKNKGKLCFPDGQLCAQRVNRAGNHRHGNHLYWMSWESDDPRLRNEVWDWFNARNYCRKRCMDLVSIETQDEYNFLKSHIGPNVKYFWTSGRLCDFDGCDQPHFFPKNINGWFWSANQDRLSPTNCTGGFGCFHDWSFTGGRGARQPDNREASEGGETESCLAVLNNFYGDGVKWHDVACTHEKPIICEDTEGHLNFARQQFPQINIP